MAALRGCAHIIHAGDIGKPGILAALREIAPVTAVCGNNDRAPWVASGHSHKPLVREERGVLYVNPGSAGPRRFSLPISLGFLRASRGKVRAELVRL